MSQTALNESQKPGDATRNGKAAATRNIDAASSVSRELRVDANKRIPPMRTMMSALTVEIGNPATSE